jgi:hypothetical protein
MHSASMTIPSSVIVDKSADIWHFYKDAAHQDVCGLHTHVSSDPGADSATVH